MQKKVFTISLLLCVILAAALLLSVVSLVSARSEIAALTEQVHALEEQNQQLRTQMVAAEPPIQTDITATDLTSYYCTLTVDSWSIEGNTLTVSALAYANLPGCTKANAQLELWLGSTVLQGSSVTLDIGEADGVFEAEITNASFTIPEISSDEELHLWLTVEPMNNQPVFVCGASWYTENGQLMLIAG